ncbi:MAG: hypothetical protein WAN35_08690 [Terracidiphilus sp.]
MVPIISGLMLESNIETNCLTEKGMAGFFGLVFDAIFPSRP